jgi:hypothetical protein
MWRGIIKLVVLVVLIVVVAAVLSPYFDLQPTTLGKSHRAIVQLSLAVPLFLPGALHASPTAFHQAAHGAIASSSRHLGSGLRPTVLDASVPLSLHF